ncbi:hypothetical protein WB44_02240 [Synechococcus sp. WH 8020]|nr:hypothetical protein WB44_02240 [Synechococcus sp. WH 8020]
MHWANDSALLSHLLVQDLDQNGLLFASFHEPNEDGSTLIPPLHIHVLVSLYRKQVRTAGGSEVIY